MARGLDSVGVVCLAGQESVIMGCNGPFGVSMAAGMQNRSDSRTNTAKTGD